MNSVRLKDKQS